MCLKLSVLKIYHKFVNDSLVTERTTVNISDDKKKIATAETLTIDQGSLTVDPVAIIRYQYDNHLGSASLELDESANIISYEEYHAFGTTSYRSGRTESETSLKRYKYVGKERDEETGLYYYGFRYYAAWICRFVSVDPLQFDYPHYTPFQYAGNKPISYIDLDGLEEAHPDDKNANNSSFYENLTINLNVTARTGAYLNLKTKKIGFKSEIVTSIVEMNISYDVSEKNLEISYFVAGKDNKVSNHVYTTTNLNLVSIYTGYDDVYNSNGDLESISAEFGLQKNLGEKAFIRIGEKLKTKYDENGNIDIDNSGYFATFKLQATIVEKLIPKTINSKFAVKINVSSECRMDPLDKWYDSAKDGSLQFKPGKFIEKVDKDKTLLEIYQDYDF